MKFLIVTLAPTLKKTEGYYSYGPYVNEINIWSKHFGELAIVSPTKYRNELLLTRFDKNPKLFSIHSLNFSNLKDFVKSIIFLPSVLWNIYNGMKWADHIHLRCPGNIGLLGCLVQILFPNTPKTVKYAGNWDPKSKQPLSYKVQQWILRNTFLTKNAKVLVYGDWKETSKNIFPFFTASYSENEKEPIENKKLNTQINFLFIGTLSEGKQPLVSIKVVHELLKKGYHVKLNMYGEGRERKNIETYVLRNNLQEIVVLHGNQPKTIIKEAYKKGHFLVFISKSEGWPKVVAEAMFWKCLPISTPVSCVPNMLANGDRGSLVTANINEIVNEIETYLKDQTLYFIKIKNAFDWSRTYTVNKFELEIKKMLLEN
jgi:glycosyltransferase involved in cell wall biosynthesis